MNFKDFFTEGTLELETTQISRAIIGAVKKNKDKINAGTWMQFYFGDEIAIDKASRQSNLQVSDWQELNIKGKVPNLLIYVQEGSPIHKGQYDRTTDTLTVYIRIPRNDGVLDINSAHDTIKMVIRHELEHMNQNSEFRMLHGNPPTIDSFGNEENIKTYLSHPAEVAAWVAGMYKAAKFNKVPFEVIANRQKNRFIDSMVGSGVDRAKAINVMDDIMDLWKDYKGKRWIA